VVGGLGGLEARFNRFIEEAISIYMLKVGFKVYNVNIAFSGGMGHHRAGQTGSRIIITNLEYNLEFIET
jgi:hypothetical protein